MFVPENYLSSSSKNLFNINSRENFQVALSDDIFQKGVLLASNSKKDRMFTQSASLQIANALTGKEIDENVKGNKIFKKFSEMGNDKELLYNSTAIFNAYNAYLLDASVDNKKAYNDLTKLKIL